MSDPDDPAAAHYGLGMIAEKVGEHEVIGHSGGYPGHITRSILDPRTGLVISVLTNSVDGPASEIAQGVLSILDYAAEKPLSAGAFDASRLTGRFANMWGVMDVVQLGERIVTIHPGAPAPMASVDVLEPTESDALRFVKGSGFGSIGEDLRYEFDGDSVVAIHGGGGMTMWPLVLPYDEPEPAGTTP